MEYLRQVEKKSEQATGGSSEPVRWDRYHQTKMYNCLFMEGLAQRYRDKAVNIISAVAAPGMANSHLQVSVGWVRSSVRVFVC